MLRTMRAAVLVVTACSLLAIASANDDDCTAKTADQSESQIVEKEGKIVTVGHPDPLGVILVQFVIMSLVALGALYAIYVTTLPSVENRSFSWGWWEEMLMMPTTTTTTKAWSGNGHDTGLLDRVLNSIDPVDSAFALMQVKELSCRRRTICELQKAASRMPILGSLLQYVSPSVRGMEVYKEAQDAGAALEDCALFFDCPTVSTPGL